MAFALKAGLEAVDQHRPEEEGEAPGISGAYRMLQDEELWHAVTPLVEGLKVFAERLGRPVNKPVEDYFDKPTSGS